MTNQPITRNSTLNLLRMQDDLDLSYNGSD